MPHPGDELASLDFENLIGGPLVAIINAQAQAALSTVNFIKSVGFKAPDDAESDFEEQSTNEPVYVKFKYPKEISPYVPEQGIDQDGLRGGLPPWDDTTQPVTGDSHYPDGLPPYRAEKAAQWQMQYLEVPILTILPIPFIRIEMATIDFNAKITSMTYRKTDSQFKIDTAATASTGALFSFVGSAKMKVSTSYKRTSQAGTSVERTYSMAVHVRAVQDEMPAGMERILGILEEVITARPVSAPEPTVT